MALSERASAAMLVISPHLDDAVLSCGALLAARPGAIVVTVFAGTPSEGRMRTHWDGACGFESAAEAMAARRAEDERALAQLDARPRHLDFCDAQYGETPAAEALGRALAQVLAESDVDEVFYPLGLFHSDHLLVHEAGLALLAARPGCRAFAYEDVPYRGMAAVLQRRLAELAAQGRAATPARLPPAQPAQAEAKRRAAQAYASQQRAFGPGGLEDMLQPERAWTLAAPAGAP